MRNSLRAQILAALSIAGIVLLVELVISGANQDILVDSQNAANESFESTSRVYHLERDILALQRYVLIYKETGSSSVKRRVGRAITGIFVQLQDLKTSIYHPDDKRAAQNYIERMRHHLTDFRENFSSVVDDRRSRKKMEDQIENNITLLEQRMDSNSDEAMRVSNLLLRLRNAKNEYLLTPSFEQISTFKSTISHIRSLTNVTLEEDLENLNTDFVRLTQLTRGYIFLVNVVMAGSANEFLFLTKELTELVKARQTETFIQVQSDVSNARTIAIFMSLLSLGIMLAIAMFFNFRVSGPLRNIAEVFGKLSLAESVVAIPGSKRGDEIGQLARAAEVFKKKNEQTTELLRQTQKSNSQQETLNRELASQRKKAEEATASKSIFLANMSHEIRTPMNGVIGLVALMRKTKLTADQLDYLEKISHSSDILMSVINDILDFSKIEAGKLDIEKIEFNLDKMFDNIMSAIVVKAREKNLNVRLKMPQALPELLIGDPVRISQILLNLCSNAVKFTEHGRVEIIVEALHADEEKDLVHFEITVSDTGVGMTESELEIIFESFKQADGSTSRKFGGTGLGLTIVRQLSKLMGGSVHVISENGIGSQFTVRLPLLLAHSKPAIISSPDVTSLQYLADPETSLIDARLLEDIGISKVDRSFGDALKCDAGSYMLIDVQNFALLDRLTPLVEKLTQHRVKIGLVTDTQPNLLKDRLETQFKLPVLSHPFTRSQLRNFIHQLLGRQEKVLEVSGDVDFEEQLFDGYVLLVEDNPINQFVAQGMLEDLGLSVDVAEDGQQAVTKIVNSAHYDMIFMDIQMPIMDGYEATRKLRELGHHVIICGLSANAMKSDFELAEACGMNDYLTKPIDIEQISNMVAKYLLPRNTGQLKKN